MTIGGYSISVVILLVVIYDYFINGYWWLFYQWLLMTILLMAIGGYSIISHWWLFYWWVILLMIINGYYIINYC